MAERLLAVAEHEFAKPGQWVTDSNPGIANSGLITTKYLWDKDLPYLLFLGRQVGSAWIAPTSSNIEESSLELV